MGTILAVEEGVAEPVALPRTGTGRASADASRIVGITQADTFLARLQCRRTQCSCSSFLPGRPAVGVPLWTVPWGESCGGLNIAPLYTLRCGASGSRGQAFAPAPAARPRAPRNPRAAVWCRWKPISCSVAQRADTTAALAGMSASAASTRWSLKVAGLEVGDGLRSTRSPKALIDSCPWLGRRALEVVPERPSAAPPPRCCVTGTTQS